MKYLIPGLALVGLLCWRCNVQPAVEETSGGTSEPARTRTRATPARDDVRLATTRPRPAVRRSRRRRGHRDRTPRPGPAAGSFGTIFASPTRAPERVLVRDLDRDGKSEIILASHEGLWVTDATGRTLAQAKSHGHANALVGGDPRGRDPGAFVVGWGYGRYARTGPAQVVAYRYRAGRLTETELYRQASPKPLIAGLAVGRFRGRPGVVASIFVDKYHTRLWHLTPTGTGVQATPLETIRMATSLALGAVRRRGVTELVVSRAYGDQKTAPGDAFLWEAVGRRLPLRIRGGARYITTADLDGNGVAEVLVADGWSANYGREARARLTVGEYRGGAFRTRLLGELPGEFMIQKVVATDVDRDGRRDLVVLGNRSIVVLQHGAGATWTRHPLGKARMALDLAVGQLDADPRPDVLLVLRNGLRLQRNVAVR